MFQFCGVELSCQTPEGDELEAVVLEKETRAWPSVGLGVQEREGPGVRGGTGFGVLWSDCVYICV